MKNIVQKIRTFSIKSYGILPALFFSLCGITISKPNENRKLILESFSRQIGTAVINGYDVQKMIKSFYSTFWIFVFSLLSLTFVFNKLYETRKSERNFKTFDFLNVFSVIAILNFSFASISYFNKGSIFLTDYSFSISLSCIFLFFSYLYLFFNIDRYYTFDYFNKIFISVLGFSFFVTYLLKINVFLLFFSSIFLIFSLGYVVFSKRQLLKQLFNYEIFLFSIMPILTSLLIELMFILNQHEVFIIHPKRFLGTVFLILEVMGLIISVLAIRSQIIELVIGKILDKTVIYPLFVVGIAALVSQPALQFHLNADIFESANYSILITDFLKFGRLPIVEHYGGHMMSDVLGGIVYGLLNGNVFEAGFNPYSTWFHFIFFSLIAYFFFGSITSRTISLFFVLLLYFPIRDSMVYSLHGLIILAATARFLKNETKFNAFLIWFAFILSTLYRLDIGYAYISAILVSFVIYCFVYNKINTVKILLYTLIFTILSLGFIWCLLCLVKEINPFSRLLEFIAISSSNPSWAYAFNLGDQSKLFFLWTYFVTPFLVLTILCVVLFSKKFRSQVYKKHWFLLLALCFSYLFNFPRCLVRHSAAEFSPFMNWTSYLVFAIFILLLKRKRYDLFYIILVFILCMHDFIRTGNILLHPTYLDCLIKKDKNIGTKNEKIVRGVLNSNLSKTIQLKNMFDKLLGDNETYLDFTDTTFMYSAIGRECPVYVSQSPAMMSKEFSQLQFINEIESRKDTVPLALLPYDNFYLSWGLDGVANNVRYYKVAEYIYQNYRPLCIIDDNAVLWCRNDRYNSFLKKIPSKEAVSLLESTDVLIPLNCDLNYDNMYKSSKLFTTSDLSDMNWTNGILNISNGKELLFKFDDELFGLLNEKKSFNCGNNIFHVLSVKKQNGWMRVVVEENAFICAYPAQLSIELSTSALVINSKTNDPQIHNFETYLPRDLERGKNYIVKIDYESSVTGFAQMFFSNNNELFAEQNSIIDKVSNVGSLFFNVFIDENTKLRFDPPDNSVFVITDISVIDDAIPTLTVCDYGYDGNSIENNKGIFHIYDIGELPFYWANYDRKKASKNSVSSLLHKDNDCFIIENAEMIQKNKGNYLSVKVNFNGNNHGIDNNRVIAYVSLGTKDSEKFKYSFFVHEGECEYLFRLSDYYWFCENIDIVKLVAEDKLEIKEIKILNGD